jgi:hypothetical protein
VIPSPQVKRKTKQKISMALGESPDNLDKNASGLPMLPFAMRMFLMAVAALLSIPAFGLDLVREGKAVAAIVIPAQPLPVESYAAKELQYHLEVSTGLRLPIFPEDRDLPASARVYLGHCGAAASGGIDPSKLAGNAYIVKNTGENRSSSPPGEGLRNFGRATRIMTRPPSRDCLVPRTNGAAVSRESGACPFLCRNDSVEIGIAAVSAAAMRCI